MTNDNIIDAIIKNISKIDIIDEPFGHMFIQNIFPQDYYNELLDNIPKKKYYTAINKTKTVASNYSEERFIFNFTDEKDLNKLTENQKKFFNKLTKIMFSNKLFESITLSFKKIIDNNIQNMSREDKAKFGFPNLKFGFRTALIKDLTQYSLGAHTDGIFKFITFLFYIPSTNELIKNGTALYKPKNEITASKHFSLEETRKNFLKIKTCPFIPNSVLIFPRTARSFHGVEEVNINKKERNLLLLNYNFIESK